MAAFSTAYVVIIQQHDSILTCVYSLLNSTLLSNNSTQLNKHRLPKLAILKGYVFLIRADVTMARNRCCVTMQAADCDSVA